MREIRSGIRALTIALIFALVAVGSVQADPNALWTIVHSQCVTNQYRHHDPAPCARVDLRFGEDRGYAVYKDTVGAHQYLLLPTARITGIESPELLEPDATNYFAAAWQERSFVEELAGGRISREWISLAVNSAITRSQDQLHIHMDCLRADVYDILAASTDLIGSAWATFPTPLAGHTYSAVAVNGADLDELNPFQLLADGIHGAREEMGLYTLVVVGAFDQSGQPKFIVLAHRADAGNRDAAGEQLQDHQSCPRPQPGTNPGIATK
ncbi:MAG: CDP-diacylglycerol diphosphatase [Mycobacterium sp.]